MPNPTKAYKYIAMQLTTPTARVKPIKTACNRYGKPSSTALPATSHYCHVDGRFPASTVPSHVPHMSLCFSIRSQPPSLGHCRQWSACRPCARAAEPVRALPACLPSFPAHWAPPVPTVCHPVESRLHLCVPVRTVCRTSPHMGACSPMHAPVYRC
ncbi:UNVERIFIED_CONTAM: hypothetical protein Sangu_0183000 [Sesamum angustifolium]|uniref:Uncharacterized protein n=1 Tax=Sesamum angustifolium TaxID=2727405 RepID=A0AAW2RM42_9LAMI